MVSLGRILRASRELHRTGDNKGIVGGDEGRDLQMWSLLTLRCY